MPGYAAFLRGVNLASRRRVSGAELRAEFEGLGFTDVAPFRASGNVVFGARQESVPKLTERIESQLAKSLGFEVEIFLRTASEVRAIADHEPFPAEHVARSKGKLQVVLLAAKPAAQTRNQVLAIGTDEDRLAFGDRELYWLPSGGTRDSALGGATFDKLLGSTTMRTKGTIEELAAKYFA
jgi:uncharacterized protein (DUF1697 family)